MKALGHISNKIRHYHAALGVKGVLLFLWSKITGRKPIARVLVPELAYPVNLRIGTTDVSTFRQVLVGRQYAFDQPESAEFIIDAGANIGLSAVFFANRYPRASIVAIEPEDSNFEMLKLNTAPYPNIKPVRAALWNRNEDLYLFDKGHGNHGFQIDGSETADGSRVGSVPGLTVDAILGEAGAGRVDILKIDIEGAEREVFGSPSDWIDKVGTVMVELHDDIKPGCNEAFSSATRGFSKAVTRGETIMRRFSTESPA